MRRNSTRRAIPQRKLSEKSVKVQKRIELATVLEH